MGTSDLDIFIFTTDEKGTKVMFDGSDKPRMAWHTHHHKEVHLNKRNISQPERMIQFEFPYILYTYIHVHTQPSSHHAPPNPDLWTQLGVAAPTAMPPHRRAKGVIDTDLRLKPNRIDYISHTARNNVIIAYSHRRD